MCNMFTVHLVTTASQFSFEIMIYERLTIPVLSRLKVSSRIVVHSLRVRFNTGYLRIGLGLAKWAHVQHWCKRHKQDWNDSGVCGITGKSAVLTRNGEKFGNTNAVWITVTPKLD